MAVSFVMSFDWRFRLLICMTEQEMNTFCPKRNRHAKIFLGCWRPGLSTDHHLFHNRVTAQNVVLPRVLLDVLIHPCCLSWARQTNHDNDLENKRQVRSLHPQTLTLNSIQQHRGYSFTWIKWWERKNPYSHLTVSLGLRPLDRTHSIADGDLLQEGVAFGLREIWSLQLAKVELHSTVTADDMREKGLVVQRLLTDFESDSGLAPILWERQLHFLTFEVLQKESRTEAFLWVTKTPFMPRRLKLMLSHNHVIFASSIEDTG